MPKKYYIKSKSQLSKNKKFNLDLFKSPFCYNETKKKYKIYQYPKLLNKKFWINNKKINNPILVVSGPARNGNHLILSLLDGHSKIVPHPGEDDFLRSFFSYVNLNEKKTINEIKKWNMSFICKLSGQPNFFSNNPKGFDKWNELYKLYKNKSKSNIWSGNQPENEGHVQDYQDLVPQINYSKFLKTLKNAKKKRIKNFFDFFYVYLEASKELASDLLKKKSIKYKYRISGSGLRREMFYLFKEVENIKLICPIRSFEGFYYSYAKTRHKLNRKFSQKALDDMWEHWRHKVIDYLLLKKKYPDKILIVRYEDLTNKTEVVMRKICNFLSIKYEKILSEPTIFGQKSIGNSSFKKTKKFKGKIYKTFSKFPSNIILPNEYKSIIKYVNKYKNLY